MTFLEMLKDAEARNRSSLCVGLDPDPAQFPYYDNDPKKIGWFCQAIVDATHDLVIAFKPQIAYFAAHGAEKQLKQVIKHIRKVAPYVPVILDAKRGDIGDTAVQYAKEAFERYGADAVTLSPFLGLDTVLPYMAEKYKGKGLFLLCKTSNGGSDYLQNQRLHVQGMGSAGTTVYEYIAVTATSPTFDKNGQIGLVVGATFPEELEQIRKLAPRSPLLIPGVGKQGGDAATVVRNAWWPDAPIVVNSSRAILYAYKEERFACADTDFNDDARFVAEETRAALEAAKREVVERV